MSPARARAARSGVQRTDHEATVPSPPDRPVGVRDVLVERTRMRKAERTVETHWELHEVRTVFTEGEINP